MSLVKRNNGCRIVYCKPCKNYKHIQSAMFGSSIVYHKPYNNYDCFRRDLINHKSYIGIVPYQICNVYNCTFSRTDKNVETSCVHHTRWFFEDYQNCQGYQNIVANFMFNKCNTIQFVFWEESSQEKCFYISFMKCHNFPRHFCILFDESEKVSKFCLLYKTRSKIFYFNTVYDVLMFLDSGENRSDPYLELYPFTPFHRYCHPCRIIGCSGYCSKNNKPWKLADICIFVIKYYYNNDIDNLKLPKKLITAIKMYNSNYSNFRYTRPTSYFATYKNTHKRYCLKYEC